MRYLIAAAALLCMATSAHALPTTVIFTGALGGGGLVDGSFTYDTDAQPSAINVRSLSQNLVFPLLSWTVDAYPGDTGLAIPSAVSFSDSVAGNSEEFCLNTCLFSAGAVERLTFSNGHEMLQLTFTLPASLTSPPASVSEWGSLMTNGSMLKAADGSYMMLLSAGRIMEQSVDQAPLSLTRASAADVPEPSLVVLLALGLAFVFIQRLRTH